MNPRNLRSNDSEQLIYEQLLAELNWFENNDLYRLCFLLTPEKHGYHYSYRLRDGADGAAKESPSAGALLMAQLSRELYEFLVPDPKIARTEAIERLKIKGP